MDPFVHRSAADRLGRRVSPPRAASPHDSDRWRHDRRVPAGRAHGHLVLATDGHRSSSLRRHGFSPSPRVEHDRDCPSRALYIGLGNGTCQGGLRFDRLAGYLAAVLSRKARSDANSCSVRVSTRPGGITEPSLTLRLEISDLRKVVSAPVKSRMTTSSCPSRITKPVSCRLSVVANEFVAKPCATFAAGRRIDSSTSARL